jgi:hypothetical protein
VLLRSVGGSAGAVWVKPARGRLKTPTLLASVVAAIRRHQREL